MSGIFPRWPLAVGMLAFLLLCGSLQVAIAQLRVGIFDSRAVALARFRSADYDNPVKELGEKFTAAKEAGDDEEIARLQRQATLHQAHMHQLVFGNGSVNEIFPELQELLGEVADEDDLDLIVSKWETAFVSPEVTLIDITDKLVEYYKPDEKVRGMLREMKTIEPVKDALFIDD